MFRALFLTFWGDFRGWTIGRPSMLASSESDVHDHAEHTLSIPGYPPHESPWQMTVPLIILATCSIVVGLFFNAGPIKVEALHSMDHWLEPVFAGVKGAVHVREGAEGLEIPLALSGVVAFAVGSALAYWMYVAEKGAPAKRAAEAAPGLYQLVYDKWRIDELYDNTVLAAADALSDTAAAADGTIVDGVIAKVPALLVAASGSVLRAMQNGVVHVYAAIMALGLLAFGWFFLVPHPVGTVDSSALETNGDVVIKAAPGMGYQYRWDADGNGKFDTEKFSSQSMVKIHLNEGQAQTVRLEVVNAFGLYGTANVPVARPSSQKTLKLGQN